MAGQILAGGGRFSGSRFEDYVLELGGPKICSIPTATAYPETALVSFYESFARRAEASHVLFHPWPRDDLRDHVLTQDVIYVGGGNTANMLAVWRTHGFDAILREAWERGALLCGWSAGMICWFEAGVTDSFGPAARGYARRARLPAGKRMPALRQRGSDAGRSYRELVDDGFPPGYAADDGAALHFVGTELREVVAVAPGRRRVSRRLGLGDASRGEGSW